MFMFIHQIKIMKNNKTALITGGTKGIGLAVATSLLKEGYKVAITSRNQGNLDLVLPQLEQQYPGNILGFVADVRDYQSQLKTSNELKNIWGSIDVLVANAGLGHFAPIEDLSIEQWQETIDVNLTGVFYSVKASLEALKQSKGYIITVASLAGTNFFAKGSAYNASKFGLVGFSQAMMLDLRNYGIKVTTIMPGSVSTYFNGRTPGENDAWKIQPEDLGQMVVDILKIPARTLPSKIEIRPSIPPSK